MLIWTSPSHRRSRKWTILKGNSEFPSNPSVPWIVLFSEVNSVWFRRWTCVILLILAMNSCLFALLDLSRHNPLPWVRFRASVSVRNSSKRWVGEHMHRNQDWSALPWHRQRFWFNSLSPVAPCPWVTGIAQHGTAAHREPIRKESPDSCNTTFYTAWTEALLLLIVTVSSVDSLLESIPRVTVIQVDTIEACTHEVLYDKLLRRSANCFVNLNGVTVL